MRQPGYIAGAAIGGLSWLGAVVTITVLYHPRWALGFLALSVAGLGMAYHFWLKSLDARGPGPPA